jgi:tRNA (Thr-GGU) A37 N-methylase
VVRILGVEGSVLRLADVDILDGTPLLDIKPWVPEFDAREGARSGWIGRVDPAEARRRGRRKERS